MGETKDAVTQWINQARALTQVLVGNWASAGIVMEMREEKRRSYSHWGG